jgi:hypothetical protein
MKSSPSLSSRRGNERVRFKGQIMKKTLSILLILISNNLSAQTLSPEATISLLTVSPGKELYSTFGHSGIRIKDPRQAIDYVYNYGAFSFQEENFYVKFLRGQLPYVISGDDFYREVAGWTYENRGVTEQVLDLSANQKERIFAFLQNNALPENRKYSYKFFYDNCSTRLRDVLIKNVGDSLQFSKTLHADSSYRQWIDRYAHEKKSWSDFGMDIAIGEPSDRITGADGAMYLPDNLMHALDVAKINKNGIWKPLVIQKIDVNGFQLQKEVPQNELFTPYTTFWGLLVLVVLLTFYQLKKSSMNLIFDKILFSIAGLAGWLLMALWFLTDHGVTTNNLNVVWLYPLLFPIALFLRKKNSLSWLSKHFLAYGIILILLLIFWNFFPQELHTASIPLILILAIRAFFVWWRLRKKLSSF